jgi:hypothetical protein
MEAITTQRLALAAEVPPPQRSYASQVQARIGYVGIIGSDLPDSSDPAGTAYGYWIVRLTDVPVAGAGNGAYTHIVEHAVQGQRVFSKATIGEYSSLNPGFDAPVGPQFIEAAQAVDHYGALSQGAALDGVDWRDHGATLPYQGEPEWWLRFGCFYEASGPSTILGLSATTGFLELAVLNEATGPNNLDKCNYSTPI